MAIRSIKLAEKHTAAIEPKRRDRSTDTRLHYHYIGISESP